MNLAQTNPLGVSTAQAVTQSLAQTSSMGMDGDDFMLLLLAQLKNQNPLEPMNDSEMMAQFTQLNSLQELQKISQTLETLSSNADQLPQAANLIGKQIEFIGEDGQGIIGLVSGVSLVNGRIMLALDDDVHEVALEDVVRVLQAEAV